MANPWFRMYSEFATDPKVQMLGEADQRRFVMLLCLRCSNGDVTLHDEEVAFQLRISNEQWEATKAVLVAKGLITECNKPCAWDKRQYASDSSAARVAAHRERKKQACNVTETPPDTDTDTDTDLKESLSRSRKRASARDSFDPIPHRPLSVSPSAWADFVSHRKAKKSKLTEKACELIALKLADHPNPDAVLNRSIENGWTGVFPEQVPHGQSQHVSGRRDNSAVGQVKQAIAAREAAEARAAAPGQTLAQDDRDLRAPLDGEFWNVA